jgi:hypothetical protein
VHNDNNAARACELEQERERSSENCLEREREREQNGAITAICRKQMIKQKPATQERPHVHNDNDAARACELEQEQERSSENCLEREREREQNGAITAICRKQMSTSKSQQAKQQAARLGKKSNYGLASATK